MHRSLLLAGVLAGWLACAAGPPAVRAQAPALPSPTLAASIEELWERGERAFRQGDLQAAMQAFSAALSLDERRARSWSYLGGVHVVQGDFARAVAELRRAVQLDPGDVRALNNLATALERQGNAAEAEQQYLAATRLAPSYPLSWRNLGILYARGMGRPDAAREAWRRYLALTPEGPEAEEIRRELHALDKGPAGPGSR